mmetsp:Transcript_114413/g.356319  ORF Transcript_114413/g.356319 Transcript_114413/m.356319 type:complete len:236 (+) Transcript_114413:194-901(+)
MVRSTGLGRSAALHHATPRLALRDLTRRSAPCPASAHPCPAMMPWSPWQSSQAPMASRSAVARTWASHHRPATSWRKGPSKTRKSKSLWPLWTRRHTATRATSTHGQSPLPRLESTANEQVVVYLPFPSPLCCSKSSCSVEQCWNHHSGGVRSTEIALSESGAHPLFFRPSPLRLECVLTVGRRCTCTTPGLGMPPTRRLPTPMSAWLSQQVTSGCKRVTGIVVRQTKSHELVTS